jgi:hypothetical protein
VPRRRARTAAAALALLLVAGCGGDPGPDTSEDPSGTAAAAARDAPTATWLVDEVAPLSLLRGRIDLAAPADELRVDLEGARMVTIPDACASSTVTTTTSAIVDADLVCRVLPGTDTVELVVIVVGRSGEEVGGRVTTRSGSASGTSTLPVLPILGTDADLAPDLRLLSSPDFLNGDVGDLADGPGTWADQPRATRSTNSTNRDYERGLDRILDDWQALAPAGVLVGGDLTDGRWGYDDAATGNFGPVDTLRQRRLAVRRAARTYYPQWRERFDERGLAAFPAMGDHEYGDDPWPRRKRALAPTFEAEFARVFTTDAAGRPLFPDRPEGPSRLTAYAGRPTPEVQVVTLDVFDITPERARIRVDRRQLAWVRDVLRSARRDGVEWLVVQGHTPILQPVRQRASSGLAYPGGRESRLWQLLQRFGVDLYLTGEVHDTTATEADGIVQVSHGGIFQFGLTTALLLDFYGDQLYVTLRDYDVEYDDHPSGKRLWETRRSGMPFELSVARQAATIGTATIVGRRDGGARLSGASGILVPPTTADSDALGR